MTDSDAVEIYYDSQCLLCSAAAGALAGKDTLGSLRLLPTEDAPPDAPPAHAMLRRIHVRADGQWLSGARALERAMRELPGTRLMRLVIRLGLFMHVADPIYDLIARNRMHLGFLVARSHRKGRRGRTP